MVLSMYLFCGLFALSVFVQGYFAHKENPRLKHIMPGVTISVLTFFLVKNGLQVIGSYLFLCVFVLVLYYGIYLKERDRTDYID